jgi:hypothetical protein
MLKNDWQRFNIEAAMLEEIREDYEHQADLERLCHQTDMLAKVHETIGIFFAREVE